MEYKFYSEGQLWVTLRELRTLKRTLENIPTDELTPESVRELIREINRCERAIQKVRKEIKQRRRR